MWRGQAAIKWIEADFKTRLHKMVWREKSNLHTVRHKSMRGSNRNSWTLKTVCGPSSETGRVIVLWILAWIEWRGGSETNHGRISVQNLWFQLASRPRTVQAKQMNGNQEAMDHRRRKIYYDQMHALCYVENARTLLCTECIQRDENALRLKN